jgi:hypothetical protein
MATSTRTLPGNFANTQYEDTAVTNGSGTTVQADATSGTLHAVFIDNTAGSNNAYIRIFDSGSATSGTTVPDFIFYAPGNSTVMYTIPLGLAYGTGLRYAAVNAGGTAGTGATGTVILRMLLET